VLSLTKGPQEARKSWGSLRHIGWASRVLIHSDSTYGSPDERKPFHYDPLSSERAEIRLIQIIPARRSTDILSCIMKTVPVDFKPEYTAVSYAWGSTERTQPMLLNGRLVNITVNLETALRHFRSFIRIPYTAAPLWIDALCINQDDNVEKSTEIQRMLSIYRGAIGVLAWLGPSDESSVAAMSKMNQFVEFYLHSGKSLTESAEEFVQKLENSHQCVAEIQTLMQRPWFRRVWIVQEIGAAQKLIFLCGQYSAPGQLLPAIATAIENTVLKEQRKVVDENLGWESKSGVLVILRNDLNWSAAKFFRVVESISRKDHSVCLWELLLALKDYDGLSSDHRDYVFALLGLAEDTRELELTPDYTLSSSTSYTQVAKAFLGKGQLRLLWLCTQPKKIADLPSWVPDWSTYWSFRSARRYFVDSELMPGLDVINMPENTFSASGSSKSSISFQGMNDEILRVTGKYFDFVSDVGPLGLQLIAEAALTHTETGAPSMAVMKTYPLTAYHEFRRRYIGLQKLLPGYSRSANPRLPAVIRTLLRDIDFDTLKASKPDSDVQYFSREAAPWQRLSSQRLHEIVDQINHRQSKAIDNETFHWVNLFPQSDGRQSFVTSKGYLGLGPMGIRKGDAIVVILGSEVPFILREDSPGMYMLVGDAYVDGIMDGEFMESSQKLQEFDIA
jgi:hypothetical protein